MKKLLAILVGLALCATVFGSTMVMAADPTPDFIAAEDGVTINAGVSESQISWSDFNVNLGTSWTISGEFKAIHPIDASYRVILAKGPKDTGHFEVYLDPNGYINLYIVEGNGALCATVGPLDDDTTHAFCFTCNEGVVTAYVDGQAAGTANVGAITAETETFVLGSVAGDGLPFTGEIKAIRIFASVAADATLAAKLATVGYTEDKGDSAPQTGDTTVAMFAVIAVVALAAVVVARKKVTD